MQRIGDHRRVEHVLDGDDVAQHRVLVVLRVMRRRDLDPGELLAGGAVIVHVAHRAHAVDVVRGGVIRGLEIGFGADGARRHRPGARLARQRDQRDRASPGGDGFRGMAEMDQIGAAAGVGGVEMADLQAHVVGHRHDAARRIAGAEIAVDIGLGQPGIFQRALGDFGVELCGGFVGCVPGRVLIDPGEVGFSSDTQYVSPLAVSFTFLPSGFVACREQAWQASSDASVRIASRGAHTRSPARTGCSRLRLSNGGRRVLAETRADACALASA